MELLLVCCTYGDSPSASFSDEEPSDVMMSSIMTNTSTIVQQLLEDKTDENERSKKLSVCLRCKEHHGGTNSECFEVFYSKKTILLSSVSVRHMVFKEFVVVILFL